MFFDLSQTVEGIFLEEIRNRFRCRVLVDGAEHVCYVASSSRLSNYIPLEGVKVLLMPNQGKNTEYTLFAVKCGNQFVLVELSLANKVVADQLHRRFFSFLGKRKRIFYERTVEGYKADIYVEETKTIIEVKTVLTNTKAALFPTTYSERALRQLDDILGLLQKGYHVLYMMVCLNPAIKSIAFNKNTDFYRKFVVCIEAGMQCKGCALRIKKDSIIISSLLPINEE